MNVLPWRVRKVISDRFPLAYHLVANLGVSANDAAHWNARHAETWEANYSMSILFAQVTRRAA